MKTKIQHTPGPWKISGKVSERHAIRILGNNGYLVAEGRGSGGSWEQVKANTLLIATAPELLESLKNLMKALAPELTGMPKNIAKTKWADQWDKAEEAIAKAEGESND